MDFLPEASLYGHSNEHTSAFVQYPDASIHRFLNQTGQNNAIIDYKKLNPDQFWKAYEGVNRSMGDYVGQNYYLPRTARQALHDWVPFWKFPVETAKVTANQMVNNRFSLALP